MIIDGTDLIMGRLGTVVAKKALLGEEVHVVNAEKVVMTGQPKKILESFEAARRRGAPLVGPYFPKTPERIVKRMIRGMLPYKKPRGRAAFEKIKCHVGVPEEFKSEKLETIQSANIHKTHAKYVSVKEISKVLGARVE